MFVQTACHELFSGVNRFPAGIVYLQDFQLHQSAKRIPGHRGNVIVAEQQVVEMRQVPEQGAVQWRYVVVGQVPVANVVSG